MGVSGEGGHGWRRGRGVREGAGGKEGVWECSLWLSAVEATVGVGGGDEDEGWGREAGRDRSRTWREVGGWAVECYCARTR